MLIDRHVNQTSREKLTWHGFLQFAIQEDGGTANRSSVLRGKWIPGVQEEMQNLLARQHFNIDPASCEYNIKAPNSPRAWQRAPLSLCFYVCVQAAFAARTKRKEHSSSNPPYLTLTGFLWAAGAEAEPVQRKG